MLYRAARRADPGYFPAAYEYVGMMLEQFRGPELRREFPASDSTSVLASCLAAAAQLETYDTRPLARMRALEARFGPSPCTDAFLIMPVRGDYTAARGARALRDSPELRDVRSAVGVNLMAAGQLAEADALFRSGGPAMADPAAPIQFAMGRVQVLLARKDSAAALALFRSTGLDARRDRRPMGLARYLFYACNGSAVHGTLASRLAGCDELRSHTSGRRGAGFASWDAVRRQAKQMVEAGALTDAVPLLNRAVAIAESIGWDPLESTCRHASLSIL